MAKSAREILQEKLQQFNNLTNLAEESALDRNKGDLYHTVAARRRDVFSGREYGPLGLRRKPNNNNEQ